MPIKPPNLDDRRYADLVREARALIPQYCPEWTNLGDADPGITLVQLFAWMTEMTIFRLNRVPDKTYVHFLNFIGEERREARPAVVGLTFQLRLEDSGPIEIPAFTRASTRQKEGTDALHYLTVDPVTVHNSGIKRLVAVLSGLRPMVRELPFAHHPRSNKAVVLGSGGGVDVFKMDPLEHGPRSFTRDQFLYVAHDDFKRMGYVPDEGARIGRLRLRTAAEGLPIGPMFAWEFYTGDLETPWVPFEAQTEEEEVLGLPEIGLRAVMPRQKELTHFGRLDQPMPVPEALVEERHWIRGRVDYERWLAERMQADLDIAWADDRGGEERVLTNWDIRATGRTIEFFIQDMPPIRAGWTVRLTLVDRGLAAGREAYLPAYRWMYRHGDTWETIPPERVRVQDTRVTITGPFIDMANDGYNLRAERVEAVYLRGLTRDLELEMTWLKPVEVFLGAGPESSAASPIPLWELPASPYSPAKTLPPLIGMKFFIGSDLFENRAGLPVLVELEIAFTSAGEPIEEPVESYKLQLCYRAADTWRVVHTAEGTFDGFTFSDLDPEGAFSSGRRKIRFLLDPKTQLNNMAHVAIAGVETAWLRLEMVRASMTRQPDKKQPPIPISLDVHGIRLGVDGVMGKEIYEQPMPGVKVASVEHREGNRRLSRVVARSAGRLVESFPFDRFVDVADDGGGHAALYMQFDRPLPVGSRHVLAVRTRGEAYLPEGTSVVWQMLDDAGHGRLRWLNLDTGGARTYDLTRSGVLEFPYPDPATAPAEGAWMRALFRMPEGREIPRLPPVSHFMLNTVDGVNLHAFRMEKFSGLGIPHQTVQLRRHPVFLHQEEVDHASYTHPDRFADLRLYVTEEDGERREWRKAPGNTLLSATKDDRVFVVDAVEGTLTFGNGIRGRLAPVGSYNIAVEVYHTVPGDVGNVAAGEVEVCEGFNDLATVANLLPGTGGRNAETIEEIIRRAPSVLTSRDRAVTRSDFEVIAKEASGEVARAACDGRLGPDGIVEVVVLPQKRDGEKIPDPFLSAGLKDHVQRYVSKRCLVNVTPEVRLATFTPVDVLVTLRVRPHANVLTVRSRAEAWVERFLDAYVGGLDGGGWPFRGTLYAQDFGRLVGDISEVRHVVEVRMFDVTGEPERGPPGWETGQGVDLLVLDRTDLFVLRRVRAQIEGLGDV